MSQLRLTDLATSDSEPARPFLVDAEIVRRLELVEAQLRAVIREGRDRPFPEVGRAADELHRLAVELMPEEQR